MNSDVCYTPLPLLLYHLSDRTNFSGAAQRSCVNLLSIVPQLKSLQDVLSLLSDYELLSSRWDTHSRHVQHCTTSIIVTTFRSRIPLHLPFSAKCRRGSRAIFPHDELFLTDERGGKRLMRNCETWGPRVDRSIEIVKGARHLRIIPRKRSMSLLAGSWRSTEPTTLKRKLNEISNRQELPRIGPIKPPPVPRTCTRVY